MADGGKIEFGSDENSYEYDDEEEKDSYEIDEEEELISEYGEEYSSIAKKSEYGTVPQNILEFLYP